MTDHLSVTFLRDVDHGGAIAQPQAIADQLAAYVDAATATIDIAIYDFRLTDPGLAKTVVDALTTATTRGVTVRIAYDAGKPASGDEFAAIGGDPAPPGTADWLASHFAGTAVELKAIAAGDQLMHSKYVIRDAAIARHATVWTGSTNFTDDAWTHQENNILTIASHPAAIAYEKDFNELWTNANIAGTGAGGAGQTHLGGHLVGWDFCPGDGPAINTALAARVTAATSRIVIAAMVLTSHEVLAALSAAVDRGVPMSGIYDSGQMDPIVAEWRLNPADATVVADWLKVSALMSHKASVPYTPTSLHNFMHLKVLVTDDVLTTGSYNFSANAEKNAENQVHLTDPVTVADYTAYLTTVIAAYPKA